jgi:STE24 endopeptidase
MPSTPRRAALAALHGLAATVVVVGVAAEVARPLAPALGTLPPAEAFFDDAYLARAAAYRGPVYAAGVAALVVRLAVVVAVAATPIGKRATDRIIAKVGPGRPVRAATAVVTAIVIATDLLLLPLHFWVGFVHDGAYGLRAGGLGRWLTDWVATTSPVWLGVAALTAGAYALARRLPGAWPAVAGLAAAALTVALTFAAPLVLEPLQFTTTPLPPGPVRDEVEVVLERAGRADATVVVADAGRRTTRQNAYVSGLGTTRRIVLYDTLVDQRAPAEVGQVLAHELGHAANADLLRGGLFAAAGAVALAYLLAAVATVRTRRGRQQALADPRAAAVLLAVVVVANVATVPLQAAVSRRAEAAADLAALELTKDPVAFQRLQVGLTRSNLSSPQPPAWVTALWATHPSALARLAMGEQWAE